MRRAPVLFILGASVLLSYEARGAPAPEPKAKGKVASSALKKTGSKATTKPRSKGSQGQTLTRVAGSKKGPVVGTRLVRTKSGRLARVAVHAPPTPSYQTHPDPDRYIEIQKALLDRGYFKGEPNGEWGEDSVDALRRFQAGSNLPDDGKISALTLAGLGLGPRHDGTTASTVPLPAGATTPSGSAVSVTGSTVGPAASEPAGVPPGTTQAAPTSTVRVPSGSLPPDL